MTKDTVSKNTSTNETLPDEGRPELIRKWINARLKRGVGRGVAGGLASALMAMPAFAQATDADLEDFQFAESIAGVRTAKLLPNGDVLLNMTDGRSLVVAAENVHVLANGSLMISDEVAGEIAQLAAAAEAGVATATAGGVSGASVALGGLGLAGAAAAAGGGGGGSSDEDDEKPREVSRPPSLNLAELQASALNNLSTNTASSENTASIEVTIGSVTKTVVPAVDGSWSVSLSQAEAVALPQGTSSVTVRSLDAGGIELSSTDTLFLVDTVPPGLTVDSFSSGNVMNAVEQGAALRITGSSDAESGQVVTVTLNGQSYTGKVSSGSWSVNVPAADLSSLADGSSIAVTANVSDRAGNPAPQASGSFQTDFTAPTLTLDPVAGGSIDLADVSGDLVLTGNTSAEDSQTVTITFEGQDYAGSVSGGSWSVTIPNADLSALSTGIPASVSVTVSDAAGNPATPVSANVPVDLTGPSVAISPLVVGSVLNAAETGSDLVVVGTTGNVTDGQLVTVTLDGQTYTGSVSGGNWSVTIPSADLISLADGGTFSLTADVTDADGLVAPQANASLSKDASAPTLSIDVFSSGTIMNALEQGSDLVIAGSTTAEDGQAVTVGMNGQIYATMASGGSWSVTIPSSDLSGLSNSSTVSVVADVSDVAGNPAVQATASFSTDFSAPSLSVSSLSTGAVLNSSEQASGMTITGTSNAPDGTIVSIQVSRSDGAIAFSGTANVSGGAWTYSVSGGTLGSLQHNETYNVVATVADAAGNNNSASTSFQTDFVAPTIAIDALPVGSVLDITETGSDLTVSGTTTAENGQTVVVALNGSNYTTSVSNGVWSATIPMGDLAALSDGSNYSVSATVSDVSGNSSLATSVPLATDFTPILRIDPAGTNGVVGLSDVQSAGLIVTGTSVGLAVGQTVNLYLNSSAVGSATVAADGSWSVSLPSSDFSSLDAGDNLDFSAQASVSGGPDPVPAAEQVFAHIPAAYVIAEASRNGSSVTFDVYADAARDTSSGLSFDADLEFDPSVVTFVTGSVVENPDFNLFLTNQINSTTVKFGGAAATYSDLTQPVVSFTVTELSPGQPISLKLTTTDGGPSEFHLGSGSDDVLSGSAVDDVIRGGGGDDAIDVTGAGRDVVVFEADPVANGLDSITGFNLGPAAEVSDALIFSGLDAINLRGNGTDVELLSLGSALGSDTGFVALGTILSDLSDSTIEAAAESLSGAQSGDEVYLLATNGTDSALVKVDYAGANSASVQKMAQFDGLSDLTSFNSDNVLMSDPTGATA